MRAPPEFREELHPEEIVHRPSGDPAFGVTAIIVAVLVAATLLRVAVSAGEGPRPVQHAAAPLPAGRLPAPADGASK